MRDLDETSGLTVGTMLTEGDGVFTTATTVDSDERDTLNAIDSAANARNTQAKQKPSATVVYTTAVLGLHRRSSTSSSTYFLSDSDSTGQATISLRGRCRMLLFLKSR